MSDKTMWDKVVRYLYAFGPPVLLWIDDEGYPASVRCNPEIDQANRRLRLSLPANLQPRPGPASLLGHQHDEQLWQLKSFAVRGRLEADSSGWRFVPTQFIAGAGASGPLGDLQMLIQARKSAKSYLDRRGLPRPQVAWHEVKALFAEAKKIGRGQG